MARLARAIWERGKDRIDNDYLRSAFRELFRPEKNEMASFFRQLPMWINDHLDRVRHQIRGKVALPLLRAGDLI